MKKDKASLLFLLSVLIIFTIIISGCDSPEGAKFISETEEVQALSVINGTSEDEVITTLNSKIKKLDVTLNNGRNVVADVTWEKDIEQEYDSNGPGPFQFNGKAKYEDLIKDVTVDVKVFALFEISNLKVEPAVLTNETGAVDLLFTIENKSDYSCKQNIVFTIEAAGEEESSFDRQEIHVTEVEVEANDFVDVSESIILLSVEELLGYGFDIEDINGDWNVIGSTYNDSVFTVITVNIVLEE